MSRRALHRIIVFSLLALSVAKAADQGKKNLKQIAQAVDRRYNNLQSLVADFSETYRGPGISRAESGALWLKKPGKMRWEYHQPSEKLFISDGKTAWFYVAGERQARKAPLKKLDDLRSPLRYLLGKTRLEKEFEALSFAPDIAPINAGDLVLRGVPKAMADRISQVLLEITPEGYIARIVAQEVDGSSTEFRFRNFKEDVNVSDQRFRFSAPPGVDVIEAGELGP